MRKEKDNFMSEMIQKLTEDMKTAMKGSDIVALSTVKLLLGAIRNKEIEKRTKLSKQITDSGELEQGSKLSDEEILEVVGSEIKKRKDSIAAYSQLRPDLAEQEKKELEVLKKYAPKELSEQELRVIVKTKIAEIGASDVSSLGKVMGKVTTQTKGRADGALVKKIVEEELSGK